jgi:membrane associated rhomboid family serine protease
VGFLVFFSILFSLGSDVDMYGHFGGMLGGYLMALALLPGIQQKSPKFYMIGVACYTAYILVTFLVFFLT